MKFNVPKSPKRDVLIIDEFLGVDFTNSPANIDDNKSPNAVNMIRDVPGKVRKRQGYELIKTFTLKNKLMNTATSKTLSGITSTINTDKSITFNGTASSSSNFTIGTVTVQAGTTYKLSGGKSVMCKMDIRKNGTMYTDTVEGTEIIDIGGSPTFTPNTTTEVVANIRITSGTTVQNLTFYPMIRLASITDSTYEPYYETTDYNVTINGKHSRRGDEYPLYHVGTKIFKESIMLYDGANNAISHSWQFNDNLYIIDGLAMLVYNGTTVTTVSSVAYIPTLTIAKAPNGGGTQYEDFNLLQPGFTELFAGTASATQYYMTFGDLDATTVTASILNSSGDWVAKTEGTDFTVNRTTGVITFTTAPGESVINGEDNVKITAYRTVDGYADRVNKCKFGTRFGVNGAFDRLFISGNPDFINFDWYSQQWDATYFSDTSYSTLGSSASAVVGYSIISNYLAAHKDEMEQDLSIILRQGDLVDSKPSFKIVNTLQGAGAISTNSFNYLCTEPVFLTRSGIYAVTAQDITGEKYAQNRSFYINGKMLKEDFDKLKNSFSIIYNDMYILAVNNHLYILDGLQPIKTDKSMPYATRQYVGFYCENVPARCMWEHENRLYFGTADGNIYRFYNDKDSLTSYSDNGTAISAKWETADLEGKLFYKNKTFRFLSVKLGSAISTSLEIYAQKQGIWGFIKQDNTTGRYFSFQHLTFSKLSFSCNATQRVSSTKLSVKKVDKARFRFENKEFNEPFGLFSIALEYQESGNAKG